MAIKKDKKEVAVVEEKKEEKSPVQQLSAEELSEHKRTALRKKLENDLTKDDQVWEDEELEIVARKAAKGRYMALQNSSLMGDIARRVVLGQKPSEIAVWCMTQAPHEFESMHVGTLALQVENFKRDFMKQIYAEGKDQLAPGKIVDVNPIDMEVIRFKDRAMIVQAMMERAVLLQEARVIKAMSIESAMSAGGQVLSPQVSEEMDRYMRFLERLGAYKQIIGKGDDGDSAVRELTHNFKQMDKIYQLMPAQNKEKFREQIEILARKKKVEERQEKEAVEVHLTPHVRFEESSE